MNFSKILKFLYPSIRLTGSKILFPRITYQNGFETGAPNDIIDTYCIKYMQKYELPLHVWNK